MVGPKLAHLELQARSAALQLDLDRCGDAIVLRANGTEIGRHLDDDSFIAALTAELFRFISEKATWVMSLHAAAVAAAGACVLMPGASGAGKSSLTAAVLSLGDVQLVADDLALLAGPALEVVPVPLPLVIKRGSWGALQSILPDLDALDVHRRFDQDCRYWVPPRDHIAREPMPVKVVVFPRYVEGRRTELAPLAPLDAFARITAAPSAVRPPITNAVLESLTTFARSVPAYALTYGTLADARWIVRDLLRT